jgi:hypothetical protein
MVNSIGNLPACPTPHGKRPMNKLTLLATLALAASSAQAQDVYLGLGAPGLVTLGYAAPMGSAYALGGQWGLRGEFAGGGSTSKSVTQNGNTFSAKVNNSRVGAFADWFPSDSSGFRLVGGLTFNDIKFSLAAAASGNITVNNKTVNLSGETFKVTIKQPQVTPYLGIGWGHKASTEKGLGFFADLGVAVGSFTATVDTSLVGKTFGANTISQSDVDAETKKIKDAVNKIGALPSVAIGAVYRF